MIEDYINKIIQGDALTILKTIPDESVNCVVTSPPYWGLRDYGIEPVIWDGDKDCKHEWVEGESAGDIRFRPGHNTSVGNNKNPNVWVRPSRTEFTNKTVDEICPICNEKFEGKLGQRFCSVKCLNTLSNAERTAKGGLSNFCLKCNAWRGSLGLEPTFELYIKHLCDVFDEIKRVLRKDGTCWVNIGDTYWGGGNNRGSSEDNLSAKQFSNRGARGQVQNQWNKDYPAKSLCLIPQRFAIEMVNRGWICRNTIIWHKPNCMPSSANDRFTVDFEYLYFFVKSKKYWFEQQFEEYHSAEERWGGELYKGARKGKNRIESAGLDRERNLFINSQGRNKRCVWTISTKPFPEAHFAVYPEELIEIPIKAGCPRYVCKKCGKARVKIYKYERNPTRPGLKSKYESQDIQANSITLRTRIETKRKELGYTNCNCNAGFEGGIVLDPFMGAGTTAVVAKKLGRKYIGIEIKQEYIDMANKRIRKIPELLF